jgi:type II secretory ATPase GspE/PulE/Tfp pilus assembly ATPase PilB-like protein
MSNNNKEIINILDYAVLQNASDIHIEPQEKSFFIRVRIDGILRPYPDLDDIKSHQHLINSIKIMAKLDISEKRQPQDGSFKYRYNPINLTKNSHTHPKHEIQNILQVGAKAANKSANKAQKQDIEINIRVSTCPSLFGEKIVLRIIKYNQKLISLEKQGLTCDQIRILSKIINKPQGLILVTGPTGSGKTQLLYSILDKLNSPDINIITIENPVEISLPGINQIQTQDKIGLNFAKILRAILRQDPDIIMIGEIRDAETANIAINAAETGHLVLATLHTTGVAQAINRLINMGVANYLIADNLSLVIASRLIRLKSSNNFKGRTGIFELMPINQKLRKLIFNKASSQNIYECALEDKMLTLKKSAENLLKNNLTTISEIKRVLP